jgi:hypothetical protein
MEHAILDLLSRPADIKMKDLLPRIAESKNFSLIVKLCMAKIHHLTDPAQIDTHVKTIISLYEAIDVALLAHNTGYDRLSQDY